MLINGKRIKIKQFETLEEVIMHAELYNDISERSIHDHIESASIDNRIRQFEEGLYDNDDKVKYMMFNEDDEFIGTIGYVRRSPFEVNIGYRLMLKKFRQKGYVSEALPLFVKFIFDTKSDVDRISLNTAYDNIGSQKVAERSGFTFEGVLRKAYEYRGNRVDFYQYSILREDIK